MNKDNDDKNEIFIGGYTFDELAELSQTNIDEFNRIATEIKQKHLDNLCAQAPKHERRLRGLQFTINAKMNKIKNPLVRAQVMQNMMFEIGLYPLQEQLQNFQKDFDLKKILKGDINFKDSSESSSKKEPSKSSITPTNNSRIIPFKPKDK